MLKYLKKLSLRFKLFIAFLVIIFFIVIVAGVGFWFNTKKSQILHMAEHMDNALIDLLEVNKLDRAFWQDEYSPLFFKYGNSPYLDKHQKRYDSLYNKVKTLSESEAFRQYNVSSDLKTLLTVLDTYDSTFTKGVAQFRVRGFKDGGLIGEMKTVAEQLEREKILSRDELSQLRRIEKDYIIRKDTMYLLEFEELITKIKGQIPKSTLYTPAQKKLLAQQLHEYHTLFLEISQCDKALGYKGTNKGLNHEIKVHSDHAINIIKNTKKQLFKISKVASGDFQNIFIVTLLIVIVLSLTFSYFISFLVTIPIVKLSRAMHKATNNEFKGEYKPVQKLFDDEVGMITDDFNYTVGQIKSYLQHSKEQTEIIYERNKKLEITNQQIIQSENRLEAFLALKDKFFGIISHDLRSPLNTIKGFINILKDHPEYLSHAELSKVSKNIDKELSTVMTLMDDLLKWSLSTSSEFDYKPGVVDITEAIEDTVRLFDIIAHNKQIKIITDIGYNLKVNADENMLLFVLRNLIANAIKYTRQSVQIEAYLKEKNIHFDIIDHGLGMPQEAIDLVFNAKKARSLKSGLGLVMSKDFVERSGGKLSIKSVQNEGTTVSFYLPAHF